MIDSLLSFQRHLDAAQGYLALGLFHDAWEELGQLEPEERAVPEVIQIRLRILLALEKWGSAIVIGVGASWNFPSYGEFYMLTARAMRSAEHLAEARTVLLSGEQVLAQDARWNLELARCECLLGDLQAAKQRLARAFTLDPNLKLMTLDDESLAEVWEALWCDEANRSHANGNCEPRNLSDTGRSTKRQRRRS